ncbi:conserved hypothetical protein [Beutenbergia cavernae DSM 12333]|uniref:Regulator of SigK n=1 Tax=Beutenbergia cavernae (strain ATCC BAA-8 / DSM 12333 / CCUG 43141 / JCM 11478 / NBRC 16432 / NCIMB 13614 / HKI 0122) TaxID=471853 RepID=C5C250_BEUC1|nr:anti-sigma factor [Beutenbergia cavernae]ACQ81675.1 conserved hypothetical protein [Beutenbergia cavernae DSM 12333]
MSKEDEPVDPSERGGGDGGHRHDLGAWALGALDDVERAAVDRAVRADPELAEEARVLRETAAELAWSSSAPPPPDLRRAVLDRVASTEQDPAPGASTSASESRGVDGAPGSAGPRPVRRRSAARWLAAAAAVAIAIAVPTVVAVRESQRAARAEEQVAAISEALTTPGAELVASDVSGGGRAVAVVSPSEALFTATELPQLDGEVYQLWLVDPAGARSAGVLEVRDGAVSATTQDVRAGDALAVTVEPPGGSDAPTSDPLVVLATEG